MAENIKIGRVEKRLRDCVCNKIDCSDLADSKEREPHVLSRAIAALAITMKSGVDVDVASRTITDGFNDLGIDARARRPARQAVIYDIIHMFT